MLFYQLKRKTAEPLPEAPALVQGGLPDRKQTLFPSARQARFRSGFVVVKKSISAYTRRRA